ncbi:DNA glycosylase [Hypoxylon trugodes]|uniref:DNA glycosylase n=1 Tax=Hypoxylon trugodes TaxID=326681 RepID=UPI002194AB85|nr:DNA glycosylase [Hypoxylon trugodes]KAI1389811.1 DNA glycosylase [Hypoxylon trugodes]
MWTSINQLIYCISSDRVYPLISRNLPKPVPHLGKLNEKASRTTTYYAAQRCKLSFGNQSLGPLYTLPQRRQSHNPRRAPSQACYVRNMATRRSTRLSAASTTSKSTIAPPPPTPVPRGRKRKAGSDESQQEGPNGAQEGHKEIKEAPAAAPTTPKKRRTRKPVDPPPSTPTPSNAQLIGEPARTLETPKPKPAAVRRLADPNATNATLLSPETSRVITRAVSPSKADASKVTTTNLLEEACNHLIGVDERMRPLIEKHHCRIFSAEGLSEKIDPFESLCSGIISQQVSGAAAKAIKQRFIALFDDGGKFPHPSQVAGCSIEQLRTAGLSQRKAEYVQGLAEKFTSGELSAQILADASYDVVLGKLIAVRGLGRWSVEMFACFGLKRIDVFSLGDLGVQRGMAAFVGRDIAKLKNKGGKWKYMSESEMKEISDKFAPYRSLFMWYMWRVEETDISTLE